MRILTVAVVWTALGATAAAQPRIEAGLRLGIDQHGAMGEVRAWQDAERVGLTEDGIAASVVDEFPPFPSVSASVDVVVDREDMVGGREGGVIRDLRLGVALGYGSTGGRIAYADYSGTLDVDRVVERVFIGGRIGLGFGSVGPVNVGVDLEARHNRTSLAYLKTVVLDGEVVRQAQYRADAQPNSAVGSVVVGVAVHPRVAFRTTVGFEESLASSLIARAGGDEERGEVGGVTVRWRGLRLGVGAVVRL